MFALRWRSSPTHGRAGATCSKSSRSIRSVIGFVTIRKGSSAAAGESKRTGSVRRRHRRRPRVDPGQPTACLLGGKQQPWSDTAKIRLLSSYVSTPRMQHQAQVERVASSRCLGQLARVHHMYRVSAGFRSPAELQRLVNEHTAVVLNCSDEFSEYYCS